MAGEKAALQLSLAALQDQFEGVVQAVYSYSAAAVCSYSADDAFAGSKNHMQSHLHMPGAAHAGIWRIRCPQTFKMHAFATSLLHAARACRLS